MPIQLNYINPDTGITLGVSYWFAQLATIDRTVNTITFTMNGYFNLAAKNANKLPFNQKTIVATFAQLGVAGSTTMAQLGNILDNFALTYTETTPANQVITFFAGGTIV